jgi:hypothetical protein
MVESVVKGKSMVLDILSDAINLELGLMNPDLGIGCRYRVDFSTGLFLLEDGSFADTDS